MLNFKAMPISLKMSTSELREILADVLSFLSLVELMKTNSWISHFHQSNHPVAQNLLVLLGRQTSARPSNNYTFQHLQTIFSQQTQTVQGRVLARRIQSTY